jgi:hypothetical protein
MVSEGPALAAALRRVNELERETAALRALLARPSGDLAYIGSLLSDDIARATRVRTWREPRPFGSTIAHETLAEVELPREVTTLR